MDVAVAVATLVGMVAVTWLAVALMQRDLRRNGHGGTTSLGDGLGNLIDVFDPGQARASRDLKDQQHVGPVTPTPDPDPEDPIQLELGPGGEPARVRIRRPESPPDATDVSPAPDR